MWVYCADTRTALRFGTQQAVDFLLRRQQKPTKDAYHSGAGILHPIVE